MRYSEVELLPRGVGTSSFASEDVRDVILLFAIIAQVIKQYDQ
jgi:hypothetical protein